jgi:PAS domain S-box-containing protein
MHVLYVEDNPFDADLTHRQLARLAPEIQLETVSTQSKAILRLENGHPPDLVLTDLRLPDGDGLSILNFIRQSNLPMAVIIITGQGDEDIVVAALKAGADDYVVKSGDYIRRLPDLLEDAYKRHQFQANRRARQIRVLYAETNYEDMLAAQAHLARYAPHLQLEVYSSGTAILHRMAEAEHGFFDVLLLDYHLPGLDALDILKEIRQVRGMDIPVLFIAGQGIEEQALEALRLGAADYLVKNPGYLFRLPVSLENAFFRAQILREQQALQESKEYSERLISAMQDGFVVMNDQLILINANPAMDRITGFSRNELVGGAPPHAFWPVEIEGHLADIYEQTRGGVITDYEVELLRKDGSRFPALISPSAIWEEDGQVSFFLTTIKDISHIRAAEAKIKEQREALRERNEQLRKLSKRVNTLAEEERKRISQELHDRVGQLLTALSINLNLVGSELPQDSLLGRTRVDESQLLIEQITGHIRDVMADLRPPVLDDYGLFAALRWLGEQHQKLGGQKTRVEGASLKPRLDGEIELALFRIAQEALTNVSRHAQATSIVIELKANANTIVLSICDDGVGFQNSDEGIPESGWGLQIMAERAEAIGASLDIDSSPHGGTQLTICYRGQS